MPVIIRRAATDDIDRITTLWLELLEDQSTAEARVEPAEDAEERWRNDVPRWLDDETRRIFVAEEGAQIVGFASAHRWAPSPVFAFSEEVYLDELYVEEGARRGGTGTQLVEAVKDWAASLGAVRLRLGVLSSNEAGQAFWKAQAAQPLALTLTLELEGTTRPSSEKKKGKLGF